MVSASTVRPIAPADEGATNGPVTTSGPASAQQALDQWLGMWQRYHLDAVRDVFLVDPSLTLFASDTEELIEGFDDTLAYPGPETESVECS